MKYLAHARALLVALPLWVFLVAWLWPRAARAEALAAEFWLFDWKSLGYAAMLGLAGGFLNLIYALATDRRVVTQILLESGRNGMVSPIAGAGAYLGLKLATWAGGVHLPTEPRFLVIIAAGYAGIAVIEWTKGLARAGAPRMRDGLIDFAVGWLQRRRGGTPPREE